MNIKESLAKAKETLNKRRQIANTEELKERFKELVLNQEHEINLLNIYGDPNCFEADLSTSLKNLQDVEFFIDKYQELNMEQLRVAKSKDT